MKKFYLRKRVISTLLTLVIVFTIFSMSSFRASAYCATITLWKTRYNSLLETVNSAEHYYGYCYTEESSTLAWGGAYILDSLHRMYEYTGEKNYIAKMSRFIHKMYLRLNDNDGDGYLGWGSDRYYDDYYEYVVHFGQVLIPMAKFILTVRNDPTLASSNNPQSVTYASQTDDLESVINNDLIPKWNKYWNTKHKSYNISWPFNENKSLPHNMYLTMANALYLMSQVTPANQHYRMWADQMVSTFKDYITDNGSYYTWNYWEHLMPSDTHTIRLEDYSHAALTMFAANRSTYYGSVLDEKDLAKTANTIYDVMWNGSTSMPMLSHYIDGTGANDGNFSRIYGDFERWRPGIFDLVEKWTHETYSTNPNYASRMGNISVILPLHPNNSAPQSFAITTPADQSTNLNSTVSFSWRPSVNAADYTLQVATDSSFNNLVATETKIIGTNAVIPGLSHSSTYYWRVIARNAVGTTYTSSTSSFTTKAASTYLLHFSHMDTRNSNAPSGYHYMQALIDNTVIWEKDVTEDGANIWYTESIDITDYVKGKSNAHVKLRLYDKKNNSNYSVSVYFDDVTVSNADDDTNGDFEKNELWYKSYNDMNFGGGYTTAYAHTGNQSYKFDLLPNTLSDAGDYIAIEQYFQLMNPTLYRLNLNVMDTRDLGSPIGYHKKQILIDDIVIWEQDIGADNEEWSNVSMDISPFVVGKEDITLKLRLQDVNYITNYQTIVQWDTVSITNTNLQNGGFELTSNWVYEQNIAAFDGAYVSSPYAGTKSYRFTFPANTTSNGGYCCIYQTCDVND